MAYAIMRCKKLATLGCVAAALRHCYRERPTHNADPQRTPDNNHLAAGSTDQAMGQLRALLPERRRKDAVLAVEYMFGASPEWWREATQEQQEKFLLWARNWLEEKYGADRVIVATIHRDEISPHMSAFVVPLTQDGRLSAKEFVGNRQQLTADQTTFAARMGPLGLKRGLEGSKARHTSIRTYYARVEAAKRHKAVLEPPEPSIADRLNARAYGQKVAQNFSDALRPRLAELEAKEQALSDAREMASQARAALRQQALRLAPVLDALSGLDQVDQEQVLRLVSETSQALKAQRRERQAQRSRDKGRGWSP
ncbi:plasmid recombination enzyme [Necator americanus]|uniref:Plasmid recombination enzyme n=1 Tax=Necator americanus TaxID=51031 RepID=W2THN6_NECAM|nr:plasmid recombination enzyme [Necator americanus]ETN80532.1 plasmid recombination enzyme [Necator americanus]